MKARPHFLQLPIGCSQAAATDRPRLFSQVQHLTPSEHQAALTFPNGKDVQLLQTFHTATAIVENS